MKTKTKRAGSLLCFGPPVTDEKYEEKEKGKTKNRQIISKIAKSMSFYSNSSNREGKLRKDHNRLLSSEASESSSNQSASDLLGKNSDSAIFSSSLLSSSSSLSSSFSCHPFDVVTSAAEAKLPPKKSFLPPPASRNNGYATGLCLVLVTLFVMVFCGRLCAILWTATWLCLVPRRRTDGGSLEFAGVAASESAGTRSRRDLKEEEKKRVVLEGFLRRENTKYRNL